MFSAVFPLRAGEFQLVGSDGEVERPRAFEDLIEVAVLMRERQPALDAGQRAVGVVEAEDGDAETVVLPAQAPIDE